MCTQLKLLYFFAMFFTTRYYFQRWKFG